MVQDISYDQQTNNVEVDFARKNNISKNDEYVNLSSS